MRARTRLARPSMLIVPITLVLIGFDRVVLVVDRRSGAGEIENAIDFEQDRLDDIVADQLEVAGSRSR